MFELLKKLFGKNTDKRKQFEKTSYHIDTPKIVHRDKELTPEQRIKRRREEIAKATRKYQHHLKIYGK